MRLVDDVVFHVFIGQTTKQNRQQRSPMTVLASNSSRTINRVPQCTTFSLRLNCSYSTQITMVMGNCKNVRVFNFAIVDIIYNTWLKQFTSQCQRSSMDCLFLQAVHGTSLAMKFHGLLVYFHTFKCAQAPW